MRVFITIKLFLFLELWPPLKLVIPWKHLCHILSAEGSVEAEFSYMGKSSLVMDLVNGNVEPTTDLSTNFELKATAKASAIMSLHFASSTRFSLCIVPGSCVSININAKQSSAAGFDAKASLKNDMTKLSTLNPDIVAYKNNGTCSGPSNFGYWSYVEQPSITATLTTPCGISDKFLFEIKSVLLADKVDNFCPCYDNPFFKKGKIDCSKVKKKRKKLCWQTASFLGVRKTYSEWCPVACRAC
mmetsp:Transcript_19082/g.43440  ORF Transcript_19082/g.43440 Transcript_19082/m.43440 type:complete len:243 (-) Transcript_19082:182-910(-)